MSDLQTVFFVEFFHLLKVFIAFENFEMINIVHIYYQREPKGVQILCEWSLRLTLQDRQLLS